MLSANSGPQKGYPMTRRLASYICHIVLLLIIVSTLFLIITIKINAVESQKVTPYFEPLLYKEMSSDRLQETLGTPDHVKEWDYDICSEEGTVSTCKIISYYYDTKEFMYIAENDTPKTLVRIHITDTIPYSANTLLALFGVDDNYTNSNVVENSKSSYRIFNIGKDTEGIYDFWIQNRDSNHLYEMNITFYNGLFTDDEI